MKTGLRQKLNLFILDKGYVTLDQVYALANSLGFKQKTAERELNPSHSPKVITIKNKRRQIVGYRWADSSKTAPDEDKSVQVAQCKDVEIFGRCWHDHAIKVEQKSNQLDI